MCTRPRPRWLARIYNIFFNNRLVSNYALKFTNKRTEAGLRGIKQKKMEVIPLRLLSVLSFAFFRWQSKSNWKLAYFIGCGPLSGNSPAFSMAWFFTFSSKNIKVLLFNWDLAYSLLQDGLVFLQHYFVQRITLSMSLWSSFYRHAPCVTYTQTSVFWQVEKAFRDNPYNDWITCKRRLLAPLLQDGLFVFSTR